MASFFSDTLGSIGDLAKGITKVGTFGLVDLDSDTMTESFAKSSLLSPKEEEDEKKKRQREIEQSVLANQPGFRQSSVLTRF